jgi:hypothetical protein
LPLIFGIAGFSGKINRSLEHTLTNFYSQLTPSKAVETQLNQSYLTIVIGRVVLSVPVFTGIVRIASSISCMLIARWTQIDHYSVIELKDEMVDTACWVEFI